MIKFFRKIRQRLLSENKCSKYLLYAIGEIVLVVIGILIALAINDAYSKSKNEEKVRAILNQIQQEIITNIEDCNRIFGYYIAKEIFVHIQAVIYRKINNKWVKLPELMLVC